MGKAIIGGIVIVVVVIVLAWLIRYAIRSWTPSGLSRTDERKLRAQLDDAARFMYDLGRNDTYDMDVLSLKTTQARDAWLNRYSKIRKEIDA